MGFTYRTTLVSCFVAYIVQAVVNNFVPLLFVTFQSEFGMPLSQITLLITVNFAVQLTVDLLSARFVDVIGYRASIVAAHILTAVGLVLLTVLPQSVDPFAGILAAVVVYAIGGGIIEVLVSPIVEACPTDDKASAMSLLHSFYCWGNVGVVLLSTVFFAYVGVSSWRLLACAWAVLPLANALVLLRTPIAKPLDEGDAGMSVGELLGSRVFWVLVVMMLCAGASEQSVSQWASAFAERGLQVGKTMGDLAGPMMFALLMGTARLLYAKIGSRWDLGRTMLASTLLCVASYLLTSLSPWPALSLVGCGLCGFSVGVLWPGTFSRASAALRRGGTAMFALLALAGDLGCSAGPTLVGMVSDAAGGNLGAGILAGAVFPVVLAVCLIAQRAGAGRRRPAGAGRPSERA